MNKYSIALALLLVGCGSYKVGIFDNKEIIDRCTIEADCSIEYYDDADNYKIDDEAVYKQYRIERCVDQYQDELAAAKMFGCGAEYKAAEECRAINMPTECESDLDDTGDWQDFYKDQLEVSNETCWTVIRKHDECSLL